MIIELEHEEKTSQKTGVVFGDEIPLIFKLLKYEEKLFPQECGLETGWSVMRVVFLHKHYTSHYLQTAILMFGCSWTRADLLTACSSQLCVNACASGFSLGEDASQS